MLKLNMLLRKRKLVYKESTSAKKKHFVVLLCNYDP